MAPGRDLLLPALLAAACAALRVEPPPAAGGGEALRLGGGRQAANTTRVMTMAVKGHTVSEVSAGWTGKVVYAVFTSAIPAYRDNLVAEMDTWAAGPAEEGRFVAVGGRDYPGGWQSANVLRSDCGDLKHNLSCKEAALLAEGAARGADWLVVVGEDNYVHTDRVDRFLSSKDPDTAVAFGTIGCGKGLYCRDSEGFNEYGGFCGGGGYIISRAALQRLLTGGAPALHSVYDRTPWPNDMMTSCQLRKHDVLMSKVLTMYGFHMFGITEYKRVAQTALTAHYLRPAVMRWYHALVQGAPDSVRTPLEEAAFSRGCAVEMNTSAWAPEFGECLRKEALWRSFPRW